jgi:chain length determinant protein tyrosine kinase EpsG
MDHHISSWTEEPKIPGVLDDRTIGRILVDHGKLQPKDIVRVFRLHKESGLRFGEAARKLHLVSNSDIQQALAVQFDYPYLQPGEAELGAELAVAYRPFSPQGVAIRNLSSRLLFRWFNLKKKALAILSPRQGDGRSYLAANLAVAFSQWGGNTLLIDADLRTPRQHQIFHIPNHLGLSSVLSGRALPKVIQPIPYFGNLSVLPAGTIPPNPLELLGRQEFVHLLNDAVATYQFVLLDTPAAKNSADAITAAARAGGALILARQHHSLMPELQELMDGLTGYGAELVGTVLNQL